MRKPRAFHPAADQLESRKVLSQVGIATRAAHLAAFHPTLQLNNPFARTIRQFPAGNFTASGSFTRTAAARPNPFGVNFGVNSLFAGRLAPSLTPPTLFTSTGVTTANTGVGTATATSPSLLPTVFTSTGVTTPSTGVGSLTFNNSIPGAITGLTFRNSIPGMISGMTLNNGFGAFGTNPFLNSLGVTGTNGLTLNNGLGTFNNSFSTFGTNPFLNSFGTNGMIFNPATGTFMI